MKKLNNKGFVVVGLVMTVFFPGLIASAQESSTQPPVALPVDNSDAAATGRGSSEALVPPPVPLLQAVDADNRSVILNKPGGITLLLGTSEDSQDAARAAGKAMHPFQGRPDFRLVVVVDLRDSMATWVPSITLDQMRSNLDREAVELKPFYLQNHNKNDPRKFSEVIADFNGAISSQLGWAATSENLRGILYGADGREIKRWSKIDDMGGLQADVKAVLDALVAKKRAHHSHVSPNEGTKDEGTSTTPENQLQPPVALPVNPDQSAPSHSNQE